MQLRFRAQAGDGNVRCGWVRDSRARWGLWRTRIGALPAGGTQNLSTPPNNPKHCKYQTKESACVLNEGTRLPFCDLWKLERTEEQARALWRAGREGRRLRDRVHSAKGTEDGRRGAWASDPGGTCREDPESGPRQMVFQCGVLGVLFQVLLRSNLPAILSHLGLLVQCMGPRM